MNLFLVESPLEKRPPVAQGPVPVTVPLDVPVEVLKAVSLTYLTALNDCPSGNQVIESSKKGKKSLFFRLVCQGWGHGFESRHPLHCNNRINKGVS